MAGTPTGGAWITAFTVGIEVILTLKERLIGPRKQILKDGAWIVKMLGPASPGADVAKWPP
jgi:hypothetical protein